MLRWVESEMRTAAQRIAEADRQTREFLGSVYGREEKYTEIFRSKIEDQLNGFSTSNVRWNVYTYSTDKQGGQETRTGADMAIVVRMEIDGATVCKGVLIQAKINQNRKFGLSVDSRPKLNGQCKVMTGHTSESFVFAYGNQDTKVLKASSVLTGSKLSQIDSKNVDEFFVDFFMCWSGDVGMCANDRRGLELIVERYASKSAVLLKATAVAD